MGSTAGSDLLRAVALFHIPFGERFAGSFDPFSWCMFFNFDKPDLITISPSDNEYIWSDGARRTFVIDESKVFNLSTGMIEPMTLILPRYVGTPQGVILHERFHFFQAITTPSILQADLLCAQTMVVLRQYVNCAMAGETLAKPDALPEVQRFTQEFYAVWRTANSFGLTLSDILEGHAAYVQFVRRPHLSIAGELQRYYSSLEESTGAAGTYVKLYQVLYDEFGSDTVILLPVLCRLSLTSLDLGGSLPTPPRHWSSW